MRTYRQHRHGDTRNILIVAPAIAANYSSNETDNVDAEADLVMESGMMNAGTQFLDSRYNLLELLTPTYGNSKSSKLSRRASTRQGKQEDIKRSNKGASPERRRCLWCDRHANRYKGNKSISQSANHCGDHTALLRQQGLLLFVDRRCMPV